MRADLGRLAMSERRAAASAVSVSAGFRSETASDCAESDEEMYCWGSAVFPQYRRTRGGFHARPRVSRKRSPVAHSAMARPRLGPYAVERSCTGREARLGAIFESPS